MNLSRGLKICPLQHHVSLWVKAHLECASYVVARRKQCKWVDEYVICGWGWVISCPALKSAWKKGSAESATAIQYDCSSAEAAACTGTNRFLAQLVANRSGRVLNKDNYQPDCRLIIRDLFNGTDETSFTDMSSHHAYWQSQTEVLNCLFASVCVCTCSNFYGNCSPVVHCVFRSVCLQCWDCVLLPLLSLNGCSSAKPCRTHRCGTCPPTGTSGSGSTGTCYGSSFGSCSGAHTCRIPASGGWSFEKNPGGKK